MIKKAYKVIGVMSGTSLDGIDLAVCHFQFGNTIAYSIEKTVTIPYPTHWKNKLQEAVSFSQEMLAVVNRDYTAYLATVIRSFIANNNIKNIDAVCSHGHTVLHQPEKGITLQIGNLPELASRINQTVVCDFRAQDVQLGGQGAPLVPIGDKLLFSQYDYCLNLGGFANCSFQKNNKTIAYDICPVNIVLNKYAEKLGVPYDAGGKLAKSGTISHTVLAALSALPFYKERPPKSLGLEWVQQEVFSILEASYISPQDKLRTFTAHIAEQIARQFTKDATILVTGGGAYNTYLLKRIQFYKKAQFIVPDTKLVEFKEALVFALLGVLKLRGEINCLASVTGASKDHSSGKVYYV